MSLDWRVYALGAAVFAACTAIFAKIGVEGVNSNFATFIRTLVVIIFLSLLILVRREWVGFSQLNSRVYLFLILSGLSTGASWLCYFKAIQMGPVSKVAPIDKLSVALTMLLAFVFLKETFQFKTILGGLLIVLGSLLML